MLRGLFIYLATELSVLETHDAQCIRGHRGKDLRFTVYIAVYMF